MHLFLCLSVSVFICICVSVSVSVCMYLYLHLYLYLYRYLGLFVRQHYALHHAVDQAGSVGGGLARHPVQKNSFCPPAV